MTQGRRCGRRSRKPASGTFGVVLESTGTSLIILVVVGVLA
jgi:hypothetical protein